MERRILHIDMDAFFASVEEVAYVDTAEVAHIEGFDEDTANEIQTRAREYLQKQGRFKHLTEEQIGRIQEEVDEEWSRLQLHAR